MSKGALIPNPMDTLVQVPCSMEQSKGLGTGNDDKECVVEGTRTRDWTITVQIQHSLVRSSTSCSLDTNTKCWRIKFSFFRMEEQDHP